MANERTYGFINFGGCAIELFYVQHYILYRVRLVKSSLRLFDRFYGKNTNLVKRKMIY